MPAGTAHPLLAPAAIVSGTSAAVLWSLLSDDLTSIKIASTVFMFVALAGAWNLLGGYAGYLNFGTVMFMGMGAYTTGILSTTFAVNPLLTLPFAAIVAGLGALLVGVPGFRLRGDYFAVATFVLTLALQQLAANIDITGGSTGLSVTSPMVSLESSVRLFCVLFLILGVCVTALNWGVEKTRWFSALTAIREDEDAAEVLGIPTLRIKLFAFVAGAAIAGVAGSMYASQLQFIEPIGTFDFQVSLAVVVAVVLGGSGTWYGPVIGAVVTQLTLQLLLVNLDGIWNQIIFGALLVVGVLAAPRGVAGLIRKARTRSQSTPTAVTGQDQRSN
ncbi:branched-chain amino acid ABC transporter permease [Mycolicibacterium sp. 624]|uniref:branched-chain amino acid ABC transporter permease n=1 Tax=Mycolicibacterium sp. 624 TaxID=3156314 RepID=UPI003396E733